MLEGKGREMKKSRLELWLVFTPAVMLLSSSMGLFMYVFAR
jgi:hypothetical protein